MIRRATFLLALIAAPAFAQNSNTTCSRFGNQVNCNTQTQPDIWGNFQRQQEAQAAQRQQQQQMFFQQLEARRVQRQQEMERAQALSAQQQADANANLKRTVHEGVASYLREGKCKEAIDMALQYSEIELAGQAKAFCSAPAAP